MQLVSVFNKLVVTEVNIHFHWYRHLASYVRTFTNDYFSRYFMFANFDKVTTLIFIYNIIGCNF